MLNTSFVIKLLFNELFFLNESNFQASSIGDKKHSVSTDYVLKVLGLDVCSDTIVGNEMLRGISGGQRKRVTTGLSLPSLPFQRDRHPHTILFPLLDFLGLFNAVQAIINHNV